MLNRTFSWYLRSGIGTNYSQKSKIQWQNYYNYCTSTKDKTTIEEFREREERKEEEFAKSDAKTTCDVKCEEDESKNEKLNVVRLKILEASMQFVAADGWTKETIAKGAESIGYPGVVHGLFPDGEIELIRYFYNKCNQDLVNILVKKLHTTNENKTDALPIDFLVNAVQIRLQMIEPYISQWPQALAQLALPQHVPKSLAQLLTLIDDICYYSGDKSVDFTWYSRRVGLATIYKMTELYMLQDKSVDRTETWKFLRNRMDEATHLEVFLGHIFASDQKNTSQNKFKATFETARNILGLSYNRR